MTSVPLRRRYGTVIRGVPVSEDDSLRSANYFVSVVANSEFLPVEPTPGQTWKIHGQKTVKIFDHGSYKTNEHSYKNPDTFELQLPKTGVSFIEFIEKDPAFTGIGESKARQLWLSFGIDIHDMLSEGGEEHFKALREVLSEKSTNSLFDGYEKYKNLRHTAWMSNAKIPHSIQQKIIRHHNLGCFGAIKRNPFELINFGLNFKNIDTILNGMHGHLWEAERYSQERIRGGIVQAMKDLMADGSTWVKASQVKNRAFTYLKSELQCEEGLAWIQSEQSVALYHPGEDRLHPIATAIQELAVAKRMKALLEAREPVSEALLGVLAEVTSRLPYELTEHQVAAIETSFSNGISCITGGTGTGKTTVLHAFMSIAERIGYQINAVALSGRAALRIRESTGYPSMTIARLLSQDPIVCSNGTSKLLIIDEASVIDLPTMFAIVNHTDPSVKIILVGDSGHLPSTGIGKILHDLVLSEHIPTTTLGITKPQEESTGIPEYSEQVISGLVPEALTTKNIFFHEISGEASILQKAIDLYAGDPEISQIIAPTRRLVEDANSLTQDRLNGDSPLMNFNLHGEEFFLTLRLNDPVIFTENHYRDGVQNGSLGRLINVSQDGGRFGLVRLGTGETIEISGRLVDGMDLGYALTLGKAQVSQFPRVIVILKEGRSMDRSWLYTAITRAESEVHIVGSADVFRRAVELTPKAFKRKTLLRELIDHTLRPGSQEQAR